MQFDVASEPVCWEGQAEFLDAMDHIVVLLTGAGYGKTKILVDKTIRNVCAQDNWHLNYPGAVSDHLKYIYAAPHDKYLTARSIPAMKAQCDYVEATAGHRIRARTGRSRDGFFGAGRTGARSSVTASMSSSTRSTTPTPRCLLTQLAYP